MKTNSAFVLTSVLCTFALAACSGTGGSVPSTNNAVGPSVNAVSSTTLSSTALSSERRTTESNSVASTAAAYTAIDAGGSASGDWIADTDYSGGSVYTTTSAINTSRVTNPAPQTVYQTQRYAANLTYTVRNLTPNGTYTVRLHFAETYWHAAKRRLFDVKINGAQVLTNFDIFQASGGSNVAIAESFTTTASSAGVIVVQFTASVNNATIAGLEFTAGSASPAPTGSPTTPLAADSLADSIGVNTHVPDYFKAADWPTVMARVSALKVRHIRDGILDADAPYNTAMTAMLSGANAKLDGITDCPGIAYYPTSPTSPVQIQNFNAAIGNRLEYVEGPNEVDARNVAGWVADTTSCLPSLKSALPGVPFISPSLSNQWSDATSLGNISSDVDLANVHRYFSGRNPGTAGWGGSDSCGVYGNLKWSMCLAKMNAGNVPVMVTETGYNSQTEVNEATQAKYLSRTFLVNLQAGVSHTYVYDLKDCAGTGFCGDGLIRLDDSVKPAFTAIANEIGLFSDPGASFSVTPISYSINVKGISNLLFQKRDGSYILALWNETASWNPTTNVPIVVAPQSVSVTLPNAPVSESAAALNDTGNLAAATTTISANTITMSVDDHVTFLSFKLH